MGSCLSLSPAAENWKRFPWETSSLIFLVLLGGAQDIPTNRPRRPESGHCPRTLQLGGVGLVMMRVCGRNSPHKNCFCFFLFFSEAKGGEWIKMSNNYFVMQSFLVTTASVHFPVVLRTLALWCPGERLSWE